MPEYTFCGGRLQINSEVVNEPLQQLTAQAISPSTDQLAGMVTAAFAAPIDYPPIAEAIIPDDSIAIVVGENVPCGVEIAVAVANHLVELGHKKSELTIVTSLPPKQAVSDDGTFTVDGWPIQVNDPADSQSMAYLLLDAGGRPYYINRHLFDADVVIPIGNSDGQQRVDPISPAMCDSETQTLLSKLKPADLQAAHRLIAHNLGIFWQVQVIAAPQQTVHAILAGQNELLIDKATEVGRQVWGVSADSSAALVVATIEAHECQTWQNVRKAIITADQLVSEDGPIVVCCDISRKPPSWWSVGEEAEPSPNDPLAVVFSRRHVYLASRLTQDSTEHVGCGYVEDSAQLQRLIDSFANVTLLRESHKVLFVEASTPA